MFNFKLERALHFLRLKETLKKMEVAAQIGKIRFLEVRKIKLQENIHSIFSRREKKVDLDWAPYDADKVTLDKSDLDRLELQLTEQKSILDQKKEELGRALMRRKGLEKLREKRQAEYKKDEQKKAQTRLDETFQLSK